VSAGECYLTAGQLLARARELGAAITRDYAEHDLVLVVPLRGSFIFGVDLSRSLTLAHEIDFVELEPFHRGRRGVRLVKDLDGDIRGRDILIAVDVVDTGLTMHYLCKTLRLREPASLCVATLLDRPYRRLVDDLPVAYVGFTVPDELFVGYGFDLEERYRNLPDLHIRAA
jgi:hypoxanthine phosphoribosyltransferase